METMKMEDEIEVGLTERVVQAIETLQSEDLEGFVLITRTEESTRHISFYNTLMLPSIMEVGARATLDFCSTIRDNREED